MEIDWKAVSPELLARAERMRQASETIRPLDPPTIGPLPLTEEIRLVAYQGRLYAHRTALDLRPGADHAGVPVEIPADFLR